MKIKITATILFFLGTALFIFKSVKNNKSLTEAIAHYDVINLGDMNQDSIEKAIGVFYLKNCGNRNLIIYQLDRDCICTDYQVSDTLVQPNDSVKVEIIYDKRHLGGFSHYVKVHCNTIDSPFIFTIYGSIHLVTD